MSWVELFPTAGPYGVWGLFILAAVAMVKKWPELQKNKNDSDSSLRTDLMLRISVLERETHELHHQVLVLYGALSETIGHIPHDSPAMKRAENALRQTFPTIKGER